MTTRPPVVVIGGGTAGSTVVSYLAAHTTHEIVLIEPGQLVTSDDDSRFHDALSQSGVTREYEVIVSHGRVRPYREARALGGGSAVNGMLLTGDEPEHLRGLTRMATDDDCGALGSMLLQAGGEFSRLWWNRGRWNPGRAVNHLVEEGRVRLMTQEAQSVQFSGNRVASVIVDNAEIDAQRVVLCAGAIESPALLLRSGCGNVNPAIGQGLQNHPAIDIPFSLNEPSRARFDASVVYRYDMQETGNVMMFAFERASRDESQIAVLSIAAMSPDSVGSVTLDSGVTRIDFNTLATLRDQMCLVGGIEKAISLLEERLPSSDLCLAEPHPLNFSLTDFQSYSDENQRDYVLRHVDVLAHSSSSCFAAVDQNGSLEGFAGISLADASILPNVPHDTPAAPVTMEALRVARILGKELS